MVWLADTDVDTETNRLWLEATVEDASTDVDSAILLETVDDEAWIEGSVGITLEADSELLATNDDTDETSGGTKLENSKVAVDEAGEDEIEALSETELLSTSVDETTGVDELSTRDDWTETELTRLLETTLPDSTLVTETTDEELGTIVDETTDEDSIV